MSAPTPVSQSLCPAESTVREVAVRLRRVYGLSRLGNKDDPLDEPIFIILSGRTQESTYTATFEALRRRFSSWDEAARAGPGGSADATESPSPRRRWTTRGTDTDSIGTRKQGILLKNGSPRCRIFYAMASGQPIPMSGTRS